MKTIKYCVSFALSVVLAFALAGCNTGPAIAATVNGEKILEQDITDMIDKTRSSNADYQTDVGWATALASNSLTPETLRKSAIINQVEEIIVTQTAAAAGLVADETTINSQFEQTKARVESGGKDWLTTLQSGGYESEDAFRKALVINNYYSQLSDAYATEPTPEELEQYVIANLETFITNNAEAAASIIGDYKIPKKGVVYKAVPEALVAALKDQLVNKNKSDAMDSWLTAQTESDAVVINAMPKGLPYDVDMTLASTNNAATGDATGDDSATSSSSGTTPASAGTSTPEAVAAAIADGLVIKDTVVGKGAEATDGSTVEVLYTGKLDNGTVFDSTSKRNDQPYSVTLGAGKVIKGWDAGIVGMKVGGKRTLTIPASLGYGSAGSGTTIPPNATLTFEVELLSVTPAS